MMPKSKNKRKNGRKVGSDWNKRISLRVKAEQQRKDAAFEHLKEQYL